MTSVAALLACFAYGCGTEDAVSGANIGDACSDGLPVACNCPSGDLGAGQCTGGVVLGCDCSAPLGTGAQISGTGAQISGTGGIALGMGNTDQVVGDSSWCDVLGVLRTSCQQCHGADLAVGAPMHLVSYEDTQAMGTLTTGSPVYQLISSRIHNSTSPMPPVNQPPLTAEQVAMVDKWVSEGAPPGPDPTCTGADIVDEPVLEEEEFVWPADCEEHYEFRAGNGSPYVVGANGEFHPNFTFDIPWTGEVQAVAIRPITDNRRVLHHWILYQGNNFLTGWAPGGRGDIPPDGVGTYMPSSGTLTLDVHYYNLGNQQSEMDQSGVEICITHTLRPHTATTFPFTGIATASAGGASTTNNTCTVNVSEGPVYLIGSSPHMHQLGVHAKLTVTHPDGSTVVVHDKPFSFEDQVAVPVEPGVELKTGDKVTVSCSFENPTAQTVSFGTGSNDEMCFNFAKYYPMCGFTCSGGDTIASVIQQSQGGGCPTGGGGGVFGGGLGNFGN